MRTTNSRGVTLLELLVAIAILAIVSAIAAPSLRDFLMAQRVAAIGTEILTDFQFARSEAVSRSSFIRVYFRVAADGSSSCYSIYARQSAECDCRQGVGNACSAQPQNFEIKTVSIPFSTTGVKVTSSPAATLYKPGAEFGMEAAPMTILVSDGGTHKLNIVVSPNIRRPTICAPTGSTLSGFKPC